jgi:hypothetical protein
MASHHSGAEKPFAQLVVQDNKDASTLDNAGLTPGRAVTDFRTANISVWPAGEVVLSPRRQGWIRADDSYLRK